MHSSNKSQYARTCMIMQYWCQKVCCVQMELYPCVPWSAKQSKMAQPDLDYIAPEVQAPTENGVTSRTCSTLCDMFSLGQTICAIYNNGKSLLQCNHNPATYTKRLEQVRGVSSRYVHQASPAGTYTKRREQVRTPSVSSRYVHQASRAGTLNQLG